MLHQADTLVPIFPTSVCSSHHAGVEVGELLFNGVRIPDAHFIEERSRHGPETVRGHLVLTVAEPPQRGIDGVF